MTMKTASNPSPSCSHHIWLRKLCLRYWRGWITAACTAEKSSSSSSSSSSWTWTHHRKRTPVQRLLQRVRGGCNLHQLPSWRSLQSLRGWMRQLRRRPHQRFGKLRWCTPWDVWRIRHVPLQLFMQALHWQLPKVHEGGELRKRYLLRFPRYYNLRR